MLHGLLVSSCIRRSTRWMELKRRIYARGAQATQAKGRIVVEEHTKVDR